MPKQFSDDQSQAILARALEIDAQARDGLTTAQLESVASELGISPLALAKAMNEHGVSMVARGASAAPAARSWTRAVTLALVAVIAAAAILAIVFTARPNVPPTLPPPSVAPAPVTPVSPEFTPLGPAPKKVTTKAATKKKPSE